MIRDLVEMETLKFGAEVFEWREILLKPKSNLKARYIHLTRRRDEVPGRRSGEEGEEVYDGCES